MYFQVAVVCFFLVGNFRRVLEGYLQGMRCLGAPLLPRPVGEEGALF